MSVWRKGDGGSRVGGLPKTEKPTTATAKEDWGSIQRHIRHGAKLGKDKLGPELLGLSWKRGSASMIDPTTMQNSLSPPPVDLGDFGLGTPTAQEFWVGKVKGI
jgi:hypothetical protein